MPTTTTTVTTDGFGALVADTGICFGGDYNPEQWPREVWRDDARLMREAGVNLVTVGVFSWAMYEPTPGAREFGWMDEVLDLLHEHGIGVDLATPTASPPAWLGARHPETLPVDADGVRLVAGSRNHFSPASRTYRDAALAITRDLARRYANHPAVRMWHVGNELGQICYGDEAAARFRAWLRARYGDIDGLNQAWGTSFWSQRYAAFDEILPPRRMPYHANPTQALDWRRYSSDLLLEIYREQRDAIRAAGATHPVTTNLMGFFPLADYASWATELDVVADDAYPDPADPHAPSSSALQQDLMRSLRAGAPWILMEQAAGAVSWRPHNLPKSPERSRLESLQAVARGADGICFFQWRASRAGAERFHSAMLPHAGPDTLAHHGIRRLGADLARLRPVTGGRVPARVALLWDWSSWWAATEQARPTDRLDPIEQLRAWHRVLWTDGVAADVVSPGTDLTRYDVVLAPTLYIMEPADAELLAGAVRRGASLVVGPFSGVADANGHVRPGRFPVLLAGVLGVSGEEWAPLPDDGVRLDPSGEAHVLGERLRTDGADVLARFASGHLADAPAITRHPAPDGEASRRGTAWYLGTVPDDATLAAVLRAALDSAGVGPALPGLPDVNAGRPPGHEIEAVHRGDVLFLLNHSGAPARIPVPGAWTDLLTGTALSCEVTVGPTDAVALLPADVGH
ncbi:beta-galactosidase [Myceligenerans salitolerans]|uniref:Beta-galactosidase n=1 Tax=Myceligenerans salitolerans TaxID=1230528 RepID=A0ABS3I6D9_9MICO|nr:beta-galactosidase [Myceligenerans salitolerans]MBO0608191.1 beta-galactosidase [Myceligenerans salitolerans]